MYLKLTVRNQGSSTNYFLPCGIVVAFGAKPMILEYVALASNSGNLLLD